MDMATSHREASAASARAPVLLLYAPGTASLVVHWLLLELGVPFDLTRVEIGQGKPRDPLLLAANPSGRIPVLRIDGQWHSETAALLMMLAERDPQKRFIPVAADAERRQFLQWLFFLNNTLQTAFRRWFYNHEPAGPENAERVAAIARNDIEGCFQRIDEHLRRGGPYLTGTRLTVADMLLTMLARWSRNMPRPATDWPAIRRLVDEMRQRPALREVHAREGLTDWIGD